MTCWKKTSAVKLQTDKDHLDLIVIDLELPWNCGVRQEMLGSIQAALVEIMFHSLQDLPNGLSWTEGVKLRLARLL